MYPAATLKAHGLPYGRYKKSNVAKHKTVRDEIVGGLLHSLDFQLITEPMIENSDVLDAAVCLLAASDFLSGRAHEPPDLERAMKEGWIWIRTAQH